MNTNSPHVHSENSFFRLGFLLFFLLVLSIFYKCFNEPGIFQNEEAEYLEGMTISELFEFREKNSSSFLPPKDTGKAREVLKRCEELWIELQEFKSEPGFSRSHLSEGTRYREWLNRARNLNDSLPPKEEIGSDIHALPAWLIAAAYDLAGQVRESGEQSSIEKRFIEYHLPLARKAAGIKP